MESVCSQPDCVSGRTSLCGAAWQGLQAWYERSKALAIAFSHGVDDCLALFGVCALPGKVGRWPHPALTSPPTLVSDV